MLCLSVSQPSRVAKKAGTFRGKAKSIVCPNRVGSGELKGNKRLGFAQFKTGNKHSLNHFARFSDKQRAASPTNLRLEHPLFQAGNLNLEGELFSLMRYLAAVLINVIAGLDTA